LAGVNYFVYGRPKGKTIRSPEGGTTLWSFYKSSETEAWPELTDSAKAQTVYQRLRLLSEKGYDQVLVWPDLKDPPGDQLKLSDEQQASLRRFATGYFPGGKPPKTEPSD
jgi:hypothetical protein